MRGHGGEGVDRPGPVGRDHPGCQQGVVGEVDPDEVAGELSKVTWPSRPETWRNTVVVIVTSIIAAAYLFLFDSVWSAFTDLIYGSS